MENLFRLVDHDDFVARRCIMINGPVIVGASPSGLALMAAYLRDQGVPFVVLERADCIASLWQKRTYDRLKLHLPKAFCQLPKLPFPEDFPEYPTQRQFIHYLESYAKHFEINPKFNSCVQSARYDETIGFWRVNTVSTTGSTRSEVKCICRWLIATTSENAVCVGPHIDGLCEFGGEMFKGLVVGCGNSGMEVSLDLCNHNASPSIVVRSSSSKDAGEDETGESSLSHDALHCVMMKCSSESLLAFQMASRWFYNSIRSPSFLAEHESSSSNRRYSVHILFSTWTASTQTFYSVPNEPIEAASTKPTNLIVLDLTRNFNGELVQPGMAYTDQYRGQSARGLILFSRSFKWTTHQDNVSLFYPASKTTVVIPPTHTQHVSYCNIISTTYSLGYSPHSDNYKVLAFNWKANRGCTIKVMTVRESGKWTVNEKNWRELEVENLPLVMESQVYVQEDLCVQHKGSIHWLDRFTKMILSFDIEKELFSTTPAQIPSDESCGQLLNLGGQLALVGFTTETVLWTSDDDLSKGWKKETIQRESDDDVITALPNPIDDRFLTWPSPNASAMEILQIHFYNRANKRTTSQNVQVNSKESVDELGLFTTYEDILLPIP
ncbi:hypothetical protein ACLB2K_033715 [Fragaria x ananassa]